MSIGKRLKEERERIGYAQPAFAAIAGTTKKSQIDYEKDATQPKAGYLADIAGVGVDVTYVITGIRTQAIPTPIAENRREAAMLDNYRACAKEDQTAIERVALSAAKAKECIDKTG